MKIQLIDRSTEMCNEWKKHFEGCNDVIIHHGDFFSLPTDCIVSPANSFGFMDGGLDRTISKKLGWEIQKRLQEKIKHSMTGELLVGKAMLITTDNIDIPYCISAPTMRVPMILGRESVNVYLATKAVFAMLQEYDGIQPPINTITISGMGTGVGRVPCEICARQMRQAYEDAWLNKYQFPNTWKEAQTDHQLLYLNDFFTYHDLQFEK